MSSGVRSFLVTASLPDRMTLWSATAAFTNWIEGRGPEQRQTWLVTCPGEHAAVFLEAAREAGITVEEIEGAAENEQYTLLVGEPGSGWQHGDEEPGPVSGGSGTRVTAEDVDTCEQQSRVIKDDYNLVTDGDCYVSGIQAYPKSGTHVITVKNVGGKR